MVIQWAFQQLWKKYGVEYLFPARLQQCVRGMLTLTPLFVIPKTRVWDLKLSSGLLLTFMKWAFQQLWKKYGVEHLSPARLQQYVRGMLTLTPSSVIPKTRNLVDNTKHQVATSVFHAGNNGHLHKEIDLAGSENLRGMKVATSSLSWFPFSSMFSHGVCVLASGRLRYVGTTLRESSW